jgi:hypothetical protein
MMAKDAEVALSFQPRLGLATNFWGGLMRAKWPIPRSKPINIRLIDGMDGGMNPEAMRARAFNMGTVSL